MSELLSLYTEDVILEAAAKIMEARVKTKEVFPSSSAVKDFVRLRIGGCDREHFMVIFVDSQHRLIDHEVMFSGTVNQTTVYPREIIKKALLLNASCVILAHNHPSGNPYPSEADRLLTSSLKTSCDMVDVRVLDHVVVGPTESFSFSDAGMI